MDHRQIIASLTPEQRQQLTEKSDAQGLTHLLGHWGAIVLLGWLIASTVPFWPVLLVLQGILIIFLFTLLHETTHKTPFQSVWINECVSWVCGVLILLPAHWFRYFHLAHHRFTHLPGKDPELATPEPHTMGQLLVHVSGLPVWWSQIKTIVRNALGPLSDDFLPAGAHSKVRREARIMLLLYAAAAGLSVSLQSLVLVYVWLLPLLLGQPFLRLYLLAEHGRCAFVANMLENTRTTLTNPLILKLAWNMPYHVEHHVFPAVPFYRLPAFHTLVAPHARVTDRGYWRFLREYVKEIGGHR